MWRIESDGPVRMLLIEASNSAYCLPDKGLLGPHAIFDAAMLDAPAIDQAFLDQQDESEWLVRVKSRGSLSSIRFPFNPLDAVGWKGDLCPVRINWRDIRPLMSHRYHLPRPRTRRSWRTASWCALLCRVPLKLTRAHSKFRFFTTMTTTMK
jgi:homogentisate 1,2-dioxygenase